MRPDYSTNMPEPIKYQPKFLEKAIGPTGKYDATRLAEIVGFTKAEMAAYLGKHPAGIARSPTADQPQLAALAELVTRLQKIVDQKYVKAWFVTPIQTLDERAPKDFILEGRLKIVSNLLNEIDSGFAL